jgi:hypothetical protein
LIQPYVSVSRLQCLMKFEQSLRTPWLCLITLLLAFPTGDTPSLGATLGHFIRTDYRGQGMFPRSSTGSLLLELGSSKQLVRWRLRQRGCDYILQIDIVVDRL